jgi:subtilisin family serine protease
VNSHWCCCLLAAGTHVAGIAAARANNQGVVGVSPGTGVFSLKVVNGDGKGTVPNLLNAVKWAASTGRTEHNIRVINLSLAAFYPLTDPYFLGARIAIAALFQEASDAGIVFTAAAGNYDSSLLDWVPAGLPMVATVTAVDTIGNFPALFSNFLNQSDPNSAQKMSTVLAAPGTSIRSSVPFTNAASAYKVLSGTSQASPHVAGRSAALPPEVLLMAAWICFISCCMQTCCRANNGRLTLDV